ncbi:NAD(+)/NADH kinase [Blastopirellula retiformator]|uniref:Inorganic polyphosphate/ATP-NAD kinase n=1 Tax=Blastopirellula retiformator TaxID=2527970 RepID=A0A5C5UYC2_9BACT|nr:NAD+ kinase [Blastopirellula retiformator]TWT30650.1 inorganic polyphosphate/ATP-NAD kinase [Blastopirellula retiformator]
MRTVSNMIAVVTRETRLEGLKQRWGTSNQADFLLGAAVKHEVERRRQVRARRGIAVSETDLCEFADSAIELTDREVYEEEDAQYNESLQQLYRELDLGIPVREVDRSFLANFDFGRCLAVVVIGQDGLVANVAKYAGDLPVIGVNPDPLRYDGVLLPFQVREARAAMQRVMKQQARFEPITLAEVNTITGQRMVAFNDFFVGCRTHASARYTLEADGRRESQSSSGVLISTGAGATGWMSSVFNMAAGISRFTTDSELPRLSLARDERKLMWAVREPFVSRHSSADNIMGILNDGDELVLGSLMPTQGVIFSDGVEDDFLEFNSGNIATFSVSEQQARLVVG